MVMARFPAGGWGNGLGLARSRPHLVRVSIEYGDDDTGDVGDESQPFRTLDAAYNALGDPLTGPWSEVPIVIALDGSANSTSPTATYTRTAKLQLTTDWALDVSRAAGGGDADRRRASALITAGTDGLSGPLVEVMGRYVRVDNVALANRHASGVGLGIGTTTVGGGYQGFRSRNLHVYDCGLAGVRVNTFNTDGGRFVQLNAMNNPGFGVLHDDQAGAVDGPNHMFYDDLFTSNNGLTGASLTSLPSPFTGLNAHFAVLSALASPNASHDGLHIDGWESHGIITRFRGQGNHNGHFRRLYWENGDAQMADQPQVVLRKGTGTGGTAPTHYVYNLSIDLGRIHALTHSGWTAGVPLFGDFDECRQVTLGDQLEFHQTDCDATNPLVVLNRTSVGGGVQRVTLNFGTVTSANNRASAVTTAAALGVIGALSAQNRGTYDTGAAWPTVLP